MVGIFVLACLVVVHRFDANRVVIAIQSAINRRCPLPVDRKTCRKTGKGGSKRDIFNSPGQPSAGTAKLTAVIKSLPAKPVKGRSVFQPIPSVGGNSGANEVVARVVVGERRMEGLGTVML